MISCMTTSGTLASI
ncbi:hypothetical protein F383_38668 [Gossypium arboreum]|uniref:Uncharacterized protein n=1 Tax=Gossypium arboreum TaxID=29729 RepID=A0A0B0MKB7_GOSAR|nr:hypothetical protein F383_38668 [Gossypium arboreum]